MKIDILAIGAHPDDIELNCAGTLIQHMTMGYKVGLLDLTKGELGTRGNATIRMAEAKAAAKILGVEFRENLNLKDGWFTNDEKSKLKLIQMIRKYQPDIVICNAIRDRHPDHGRASQLVSEACFYAGLEKIKTHDKKKNQKTWRPKNIFHCIQDRYIKPDFVIDVTPVVEKKMEAILAFSSQFYNPKSKDPETPISGKLFLDFVKSRMIELGREAGLDFAEGFTVERYPSVDSLFVLK